MKKKLLENPGLKLLALVMAVLLWLIIVNIEDPVDTKRFTNIAVTIQNESIILNDGKMYQITNDTATVDVTVSAKRSILTRIQSSDIVATANVENLHATFSFVKEEQNSLSIDSNVSWSILKNTLWIGSKRRPSSKMFSISTSAKRAG